MKLYHYWRSSCSWRVRAALAAKNLDVELELVDISRAGMAQDEPDYKSRNPMKQVPTLVVSDGATPRYLGQSMAIIEYLEEQHPEPALLPSDPWQRARARQIAEMVNAGIQPLQNIRVLERVDERGSDSRSWAVGAIERGLQAIESLIADTSGTYCLGDSFGLADIFVYPQIYNAQGFSMSLDSMPKLAGIAANCAAHRAFVETHPDQGAS